MLAAAGGVALVPDVAQIKVERGGQTGRIWLQDLYDNPRYDIALRAGDRIIVEEDRRSFTALGATTGQSRVPFNKRDLSVIEAIATVGGLDGRTANPSGVFVFRDEPAAVANRVLARGDLVGTQRMAYLLEPDRARRGLRGARVHHPRRGHDLHRRDAARDLDPGAGDRNGGRGHRDHGGQARGLKLQAARTPRRVPWLHPRRRQRLRRSGPIGAASRRRKRGASCSAATSRPPTTGIASSPRTTPGGVADDLVDEVGLDQRRRQPPAALAEHARQPALAEALQQRREVHLGRRAVKGTSISSAPSSLQALRRPSSASSSWQSQSGISRAVCAR